MQAYGYDGTAISEGDRVELHPGTDLWMRGARFGTVERVSPRGCYVRLDRLPARAVRFAADRVRCVV